MTRTTILTALTGMLLLSTAVHAETDQEKGLRLAVEADEADEGWGDSRSEMVMTLRNRQGDESVRYFRGQNGSEFRDAFVLRHAPSFSHRPGILALAPNPRTLSRKALDVAA